MAMTKELADSPGDRRNGVEATLGSSINQVPSAADRLNRLGQWAIPAAAVAGSGLQDSRSSN